MALALYRKYRPATFAEVLGQEHVTEPLRTALAAGRVHHAYLFSGPRGCGKTSSARILARSLNCLEGPTADPCGVCPSCLALAPGGPGNIDVIELDAASHGGVEDARELRDRAFYTPAESRYRVFIIDEAHMVTTQGFNALLKIVEEPPEHLVFVFATTEPDKVLSTIRSRTHHYPFRLFPPRTMRRLLERVCAEEGVHVEPAVYPLVIRAGGGSPRDSLSVLDQLLAGAGAHGVSYARAVALLGVTDVALIDEMVDALAAADGAAVFGTVDRLVEAGHDPRRFAFDLLQRFRDLVLLQVVPDAAGQGLVDVPEDQLGGMADQAERLGAGTLTRFAEIVHTGLTEMRGATAPRLLLELLCARMLLPAAEDGDAALLHRMERLERRMNIAADATEPAGPPAPPPAAKPAPPPDRAADSAPPAEPPATPDAAAVRRVWPVLLDAVRERSRATQVLLSNATAHAVEGDVLVLTLPTTPLARRLAEERNVELVRAALREVLGVDWQLRCEQADGGSTRLPTTPRTRPTPPRPTPPRLSEQPGRATRPSHDDDAWPPSEPPEPPEPDGPGPRQAASADPAGEPDEEGMLAEAALAHDEPTGRRDPEEAALELLAEQLGARRIDGS